MTVDRYTKFVLTVIAAALVWLCVRDLTPVASAQADGRIVSADSVSERNPLPVKIVSIERAYWGVQTGPFNTGETKYLPWQAIPTTTASK